MGLLLLSMVLKLKEISVCMCMCVCLYVYELVMVMSRLMLRPAHIKPILAHCGLALMHTFGLTTGSL